MKALVIGGGIGGLATALSLHAVGMACEVFEQSRGIRELGVGINVLPHAVKEFTALGLLAGLDRVAVRTAESIYTNRFGQVIWREPRGLEAGYDYPQFSIHRGRLQGVLYEATRARIGADHVHTAHRLHGVAQDAHGVTATFTRRDGAGGTVSARGDVLIAADGMHSTVRRLFYPDEGPPTWNGVMIWRGAVAYPPFLTGRSMLIAGGMRAKLVLYPIAPQTGAPGTNLLNWAVTARLGDGSAPPPRREDWNRASQLDEILPHVEGVFHLPTLDPVDVIRATVACYEYPMCDRDPRRCAFDPAVLQCQPQQPPHTCLNAAQVRGLQKVYAGAHHPRTGRQIFPGSLPGGEVAANWGLWIFGTATPPTNLQHLIQDAIFKFMVFEDPHWNWTTFDFDRDVRFTEQKVGGILNATDPDLRDYKRRGGKIIMYHGWSDPAISAQNSIAYYRSVLAAMRCHPQCDHSQPHRSDTLEETQEFFRLFMAPGMGHCRGGAGPNTFDALTAIERWVEEGIAPDTIIASHATGGVVDRTRPLCPYPAVARYTGSGSIDEAANFVCRVPRWYQHDRDEHDEYDEYDDR